MKRIKIYMSFFTLLPGMLMLVLVFSVGIWPQNAEAHKGHAGPMVVFITKRDALKKMLPSGARIVKRKQPLSDKAIGWAKKKYSVDLDEDFYSYYLASNKETKVVVGAAYVGKMAYRHGDLHYAVGIDATGRIVQAAILGVNEKYVVDFDGNVGTGIIADYASLNTDEAISKAKDLSSSDKPTRDFAAAIRNAVVLLQAFINIE